MIGVAAYGRFVVVIETVTVMSGLVVCGVLLLLVSIVGLVAATRHHQVLLFFVSFIAAVVSLRTDVKTALSVLDFTAHDLVQTSPLRKPTKTYAVGFSLF